MNFWKWLTERSETLVHETVNPATGMLMVSQDCTGLDIAGNPYGIDTQYYSGSQSTQNYDCENWYEG